MRLQKQIEDKLRAAFPLKHLVVENESHMHQVPPNSETHFKVLLVSDNFEGALPVKRHQNVYKVLSSEVKKIHALALHVYTSCEWSQHSGNITSPACAKKQ